MILFIAIIFITMDFIYDIVNFIENKKYMLLTSPRSQMEIILFSIAFLFLGSAFSMKNVIIILILYFILEICIINIVYLCRTKDWPVIKKTVCAVGVLLAIGVALLAVVNVLHYVVKTYIQ